MIPWSWTWKACPGYLQDRVVLVTGAGGSIGSELVRQVAAFRPARIVLLGHGENSLYDTQQELRHEAPELDAPVMLASITDRIAMQDVMHRYRPDVVFHAAAHKHVPLLEANPDAAVANNVGGTLTVARAALEAGVPRLVNISTDKAVRPASMLGVTKALAERVIRALAEEAGDDQTYVSVRFGNVLGSRGSVVPLFTEQIRHGGPVTVTRPRHLPVLHDDPGGGETRSSKPERSGRTVPRTSWTWANPCGSWTSRPT